MFYVMLCYVMLCYVMLCKGYFRGYVIYLPRAQPEVNKSHIPEVPKNNWFIFQMGEVSTVA